MSKGRAAHDIAWTEIGAELDALERRLRDKEAAARTVARTARRRHQLAKWDKFNAVARIYKMVRQDIENLRLPF